MPMPTKTEMFEAAFNMLFGAILIVFIATGGLMFGLAASGKNFHITIEFTDRNHETKTSPKTLPPLDRTQTAVQEHNLLESSQPASPQQ